MAAAQPVGPPERQSLVHDGRDRGFYVVEPPAVAAGTALVPAVIVLHGGGGNGLNAIEMTGFDRKAREEGFIAVFPEGTGRTRLLTWNAGHCCAYAMTEEVDDIGFIGALMDELVRSYPVDPARIYVTGMSNGAMMTHQLAIAMPDRIAAIGPVVGALFGDEVVPAGPVPAIIINGADDALIPFAGGPPPRAEGGFLFGNAWDGTELQPSRWQGTFWLLANGCAGLVPPPIETPTYTLWAYDCPAGAEVELYLVRDNGHAWPGGQAPPRNEADIPTTAFDATDMIWAFFSRHALPAR
ncbi:MAG: polyhydroxybutyrate depolymerase [Bauldia sp.]|nr:polyhydroxybutyrate depolymerase [Bauldia sp.]